jgi:hypothetical protein
MAAGAPALPLGLDPLIAEARERARRRRLVALVALMVVAAAAASTTYDLRSSGNSLGLCTSVPAGWKETRVTTIPNQPPTVVLTNFRFGRMNDLYGLSDRFAWPANGVTVAVVNEGPQHDRAAKEGALRVSRADFHGLEGATQPAGGVTVRSGGRILLVYVEVGKLTANTIALANQALAGVRVCSA